MDVWIEPSNNNAQKVADAIDEFGFETDMVREFDFEKEPILVFHLGEIPFKIDVTTHISGVKFEDAYPRRILTQIGDLELPFIGLEDLKKNKKWSGRHKDLNDLENLP